MAKKGTIFQVSESEVKAYEMIQPPRKSKPGRNVHRNGMGVTAIMGLSNGRGAKARFLSKKKSEAGSPKAASRRRKFNLNPVGEGMLFMKKNGKKKARRRTSPLGKVSIIRTLTRSKKTGRSKRRTTYAGPFRSGTISVIKKGAGKGKLYASLVANKKKGKKKVAKPFSRALSFSVKSGKPVYTAKNGKKRKASKPKTYSFMFAGKKKHAVKNGRSRRRFHPNIRPVDYVDQYESKYRSDILSEFNAHASGKMLEFDDEGVVQMTKYGKAYMGKIHSAKIRGEILEKIKRFNRSIAEQTKVLKQLKETRAMIASGKRPEDLERRGALVEKMKGLSAEISSLKKELKSINRAAKSRSVKLTPEVLKMVANKRKGAKKSKSKGRRKQTAKQRAASLKNLRKARAARKAKSARKASRKPATRKVRKARKGTARKARKHSTRRVAARKPARKGKSRKARKGGKRKYKKISFMAKGKRITFKARKNALLASIQNILPVAGVAVGALVAHQLVSSLLADTAKSVLPKGGKSLAAAVVAVAGIAAVEKFAPAHMTGAGVGLLVSTVLELVKDMAPTAGKYLGLSGDVSLLPQYSVGSYYQAAAGSPMLQAAAGQYVQAAAGEYFNDSGYMGTSGLGEYFVNQLDVQGTSDYEITNAYPTSGLGATYDGIRPDANLDSAFQYMEAAAGLGAMYGRETPGSVSSLLPHEKALPVQAQAGSHAESGIFDQGGGNGVLS